ncbi:hypothetical protein MD484_g3924, partial [Candolleomyces efflorescens]
MPGQASRDRSVSLSAELELTLIGHPRGQIRDLEARVEILSGGKDEALGEMRNVVKDLMTENQNLRNMLRSLATFIGEGLGGVLPKLGWDLSDFNTWVNKGETDTAWEGYQRRKKLSHQAQADAAVAGTSSLNPTQGQKRPAEDVSLSGQTKRTRGDDGESRASNGFNNLLSPVTSSNNVYPQDSRNLERPAIFSDMMRNSANSGMFVQSPSPSSSSLPYGGVQGTMVDGYQNSYLGGMNMPPLHQPIHQTAFDSHNGPPQTRGSTLSAPVAPDDEELDNDPNKSEAYKLIHYHLENYKRNSSYCLPSSLRPTATQRSIPHESVLDSILHPELRDRLIVNRPKYELTDFLIQYRRAVTIHGDDVLAHSNWEVSEQFFRTYPFLADPAIFALCNRWRKERGESPLRIEDFGASA